MKRVTTIAILWSSLLFSCNQQKRKIASKFGDEKVYTKELADTAETIRYSLSVLERSPNVITGGVGFTGEETPAGIAYQKLFLCAPDSIWVRLSYSENPVLRMYAYLALLNKKSPELKGLVNRLKTDTAVVCEIDDDVTMTSSIGWFVSPIKSVRNRKH